MMLPDSAPRFLFDVMLARLCRYVRAAGYDAALAEATETDRELIARARAQGRWLITLDRRMLDHKAASGCVVLLEHATVERQARVLAARFHLDWLAHAFTRCLLDNSVLMEADAALRVTLPPDVQASADRLLCCPACQRVYWEGSHVRRMRVRLAAWQAAQGAIS